MRTTFHLNTEELTDNFLKALKTLFKNQEITLTVQTEDETSYLLSDPENRKRLMEAKEATEGYSFSPSEYDELVNKLEEGEELSDDDLRKVSPSK